MPLREAARPAPKACEHSVESPRLRPIPIESPDILLYIFPSAAPAYCERTWSKWPTKASVTRSLAQLHRFRSIAGHAKRHNWLRLASCASAVYPHCGRCDCQPFTCRRRHASMPTSARAFLAVPCEASPERDTRVISHDRRVEKISPAPLSGRDLSFNCGSASPTGRPR